MTVTTGTTDRIAFPRGRPARPLRAGAAALAKIVASIAASFASAGTSSQLGPDAETEIGRATGARI